MGSTFQHRIAQAIGDPGSITVRQAAEPKHDGLPERDVEPLTRWQTRAVLEVISEDRWAPDTAPAGGGGSGIAVLFAVFGLLMLGVGLWLGAVWL